eukprot:572380_1
MLKKFGSMGQSLRDVTKSYATKAAAKINELQTLPQEIPENWDERIDENGKPYYVDTVTGEWYRVRAKQHKRIDTNEKISILTAESKKEFDDQKDKMLDEDSSLSESYSDNDLPSDTPPDDTNTKGGTPNGNGHTNANTNEHETKRTRAKSNHSKRSSTSVSQGWQCGQCTLENVGNAQTCNACLAPRPERPDEDEDELAINSGIQAMEERVTQGSTDDDLLSVEDRQHQQQSTMDAINSAMTESLDALGGDEIKGLTEEQRTQLLMFMDCVETEPEPSIKYLRGSNWDLEHAIETYFQQHPDHPKSRGGSLQFDLSQLHDIYAEDMDFEADVQLPDVIVHKTKEAPSGQQSDFDVQLDKYRKEVDTLKAELKEQHEDNDRLKVQNEELQIEKDRYAIQSREIQNDWECGQCTFPNVGNAQTCNACLAPRPERNVESTDPQHQRQSTIDAINSAMTESLDALGGDEIKGLTEEQRTQLLMFMDCVETEPEPSIKYLRGSNWDLEHAIETYFQQHPDHPKSRGGSLQFDLSQLHDIYAEDMDFEADVQLPDDIVHKTKAAASGRRDSTELDELPNGDGHGARESDNEDHDSDSDKQISYEPMQASGMYDDASAYGSHRRMNTDQQMAVAEQLSVQQSDFDVQLDKYRKEVEALKAELKEQYEENDRLKVENEELQIEKDRYAIQSREIQNDWDRMSGYMGQILGEVAFIEECRKKGEDISTPTPKLNNIFQAIQHTISRNNNEEMNEEEEDEMMNMMDNTQQMNEVSDIYENVADLFTEEAPVVMEKTPLEANPNKNRKRKLSFGAVNELFAGGPPIIDDDGEVHMPEPAPNNFLSVVGGHGDDDKRLSYGGVGLLFDTQDDGDKEEEETKEEEEEEIEMDALNINFKPTYEGIASLFDESENVLSDTAHNKGKPSFAGDIVELFKSPHDDDEDDEDSGSGSEAQSPPPPEDEEESTDSMDKQRVYTYASSDDIDGEDEEDGDEAKEESKHNRRESYASNLSDPTPLSRRGSTSGKRHTRGPSFAFKDLFRGDDENDSEDRAPSVQSAPEEHDYYAITAYYGIEDDDGTGWDSRRSSLFGDYGRVHSRRQSKRVQSQMVGDN